MGMIIRAVDENYKISTEFKNTWTTLQKFGRLSDKRIRQNLTYFFGWMETYLGKEKFFEIIGKSYDLEDSILFRVQNNEDKKRSGMDGEANEPKKFEKWLMSNIFRYVENPAKEKNPLQKYIGKVKFTKIIEGKFAGEVDKPWIPPKKDENGEDLEERTQVDDIEIVVYSDSTMEKERKYENEHGWKEEWVKYNQWIKDNQWIKEWDNYGWFLANSRKIPDTKDEARYKMHKEFHAFQAFMKEFKAFEKKWSEVKTKMRVPGWYHFDPKLPEERPAAHNKMKEWDQNMFNFLKKQKWVERTNEKDEQGRYLYEEKSSFVVNCGDLLGIGGEGIVIRKSVSEKLIFDTTPEQQNDRKYEALKIIPIENFNYAREFKHDSLMEYLHKKLDFIKVFGQNILVMVIGKFYFLL